MEDNEAIERMRSALQEYADGRASDLARGAETPHLAGLLVQKFGYGLAEAAKLMYGARAAHAVMREVDAQVERLDPDWHRHAQARWAARPADVTTRS